MRDGTVCLQRPRHLLDQMFQRQEPEDVNRLNHFTLFSLFHSSLSPRLIENGGRSVCNLLGELMHCRFLDDYSAAAV